MAGVPDSRFECPWCDNVGRTDYGRIFKDADGTDAMCESA